MEWFTSFGTLSSGPISIESTNDRIAVATVTNLTLVDNSDVVSATRRLEYGVAMSDGSQLTREYLFPTGGLSVPLVSGLVRFDTSDPSTMQFVSNTSNVVQTLRNSAAAVCLPACAFVFGWGLALQTKCFT